MSRAKLVQILQALGEQMRADVQHVDRQETPAQRPIFGHDAAAIDKWKADVEAGSGNDTKPESWKWTPGSTDFEAEWARLPSAITSLRSSMLFKELVITHSTGKTSFQRSLPVLPNGLDRFYLTRPTIRKLLQELDEAPNQPERVWQGHGGVFQNHVDSASLCEALWESYSGVPRKLAWYANMPDEHVAFASCHPVGIDMCARKDLGLSPVSRDSASHVIHCGVAGAKTPLIFVGPAVGLLYAVVQGTLLLLSWPGTERNFDVWYRVSRGIPLDTPNIFFCLKEPHINVLRTGDAFHLPAGTVTFMMALSHVGMVSREILNPDPTEINNIVNLSNRMMDFFIAQQNIRYSGLDHVEVQRIENNKAFWDQIVGEIRKRKVPRQEHQPDEHTVENVRKDIQEVGPTLKVLTRGMQKVGKKIRRYYKMVEAGRPRARPEGCSCPRGRQDETRDAVGGVVSTAGGSSASSSSDSDHSSSDHLSKCVKSTNKGKCRVHD